MEYCILPKNGVDFQALFQKQLEKLIAGYNFTAIPEPNTQEHDNDLIYPLLRSPAVTPLMVK